MRIQKNFQYIVSFSMKVSSLEAGACSNEEVRGEVPEEMEGEEEAMDVVSRKPEEKPEAMESYFSAGNSQISLVSTSQ